MTRRAFMELCRQHVTGDDPPMSLDITRPSPHDYTGDAHVVLTVTRAGGTYGSTLYTPTPGRQYRDFIKRDELLARAYTKYERWLVAFRGSQNQGEKDATGRQPRRRTVLARSPGQPGQQGEGDGL